MAAGEHKYVRIARGDLVIISARVIPGNERTVGRVINALYRRGAEVLYEDNAFVHVSGHASQEDLKLMLSLTRPRYFVPVHGEYRHLLGHARLAESVGIAPERIFLIEDGAGRGDRDERRARARPGSRPAACSSTARASATSAPSCCAIARSWPRTA